MLVESRVKTEVPKPRDPRPAAFELQRRLRGPQRHRLLHGYPMAPLMQEPDRQFDARCDAAFDPARPLIVGVIPHTMCNPKVRGCGFCTFPHEPFHRPRARRVADAIHTELDQLLRRWPDAEGRRVDALYFGGGTANLTPAEDLYRHAARLRTIFDLDDRVECSLEGAPVYFGTRGGAVLDALPFERLRISMGVQTFDPARIEAMGRTHLGGREHILRALLAAARRGAATSADLLVNLPAQTREQMLDDVDQAIDLGFDQICIYHLVLFPRLQTPWAGDGDLLAALPGNRRAYFNWAAVRERLLERGYVQRTLTNFERADLLEPRRFIYEHRSYHPETHDALGFGPAGLSTLAGTVKWSNGTTIDAYLERLATGRARDRVFAYDDTDRRLLYITRKLPLLGIPRAGYRALFGTTVEDDFGEALTALLDNGLLKAAPRELALTPRGMFFADSVAGLFAWRRTAELRADLPEFAPQHSMMG